MISFRCPRRDLKSMIEFLFSPFTLRPAMRKWSSFNEWAIREASKAIRLWISYWRVILWSLCGPHGEASRKDGDWGNDISCSRADQYGRKLRFKDFCRHPDVALPEGFKRPKFSKYNGISYHHLLSFCGDCRGLDSQSGLFFHLYHKSLEGEALK